jgi:hypothetical protein
MLMNPPIPLCWILYYSWIQKQGDFFVESPIILQRYYLVSQNYDNGKFCTFPCIELLNKICWCFHDPYFLPWSWKLFIVYGCLQGGTGSKDKSLPQKFLSRMISPQLYWVWLEWLFPWTSIIRMNLNSLCGNNPDRQNIYSTALGLYNSEL